MGLAVEFGATGTGGDFHAFGGLGAEVKVTGINQADGFLAAVGELDGVADDFAFEIDVGFGEDGDVGELVLNLGHAVLLA